MQQKTIDTIVIRDSSVETINRYTDGYRLGPVAHRSERVLEVEIPHQHTEYVLARLGSGRIAADVVSTREVHVVWVLVVADGPTEDSDFIDGAIHPLVDLFDDEAAAVAAAEDAVAERTLDDEFDAAEGDYDITRKPGELLPFGATVTGPYSVRSVSVYRRTLPV